MFPFFIHTSQINSIKSTYFLFNKYSTQLYQLEILSDGGAESQDINNLPVTGTMRDDLKKFKQAWKRIWPAAWQVCKEGKRAICAELLCSCTFCNHFLWSLAILPIMDATHCCSLWRKTTVSKRSPLGVTGSKMSDRWGCRVDALSGFSWYEALCLQASSSIQTQMHSFLPSKLIHVT